MLKLPFFALVLSVGAALADEIVTTSEAVDILSNPAYAPLSRQEWRGVPNKIDPHWLDHFISTYPQADEMSIAFTLRYQLVQGSRSIPEYQRFIAQYPYSLAAHQATHELFQLYRQRHDLAGYLEFMYRYPGSQHALVANAQAQAVAFEQVVETNKLTEYDAFMQLFPTAPQVPAAEKLAQQKAAAEELEYLNAQRLGKLHQRLTRTQQYLEQLEADPNAKLGRIRLLERIIRNVNKQMAQTKEERARELCRKLETQASLAETQARPDSEPAQAQLLQQGRQFQRLAFIIRSVYKQQPAASCVREEQRYQRLIAKLDQLRQTIVDENTRLIDSIRQEFTKTRTLLTESFGQLHRDNLAAQQSLEQLLNGVEQLHQDLQMVNQNLRQIHQEVVDVRATIETSNQHLALLHQDLNTVHQRLVNLNEDLNRGMTAQQQLLATVVVELDNGFQTLHQDMQGAMQQEKALHQQLQQVEQQILQATDETRKTFLRNHQQRLKAEAQHTRTLIKQMQHSTQAIVNSQTTITSAIQKQTQTTLYNNNRLLESNRQTRAAIQQMGQQTMTTAQNSGGGGGGILGTVVNVGKKLLSFF
jgi:chromosome segregation ATPase